MTGVADTQVLIVGAGPTGLTLAGELRRRKVDCVLIDSLEAPQSWDRATVVHPRTLELMASVGIAERLVEAGVEQRYIHLMSGGEQLAEIDLVGSGSPFGFNLNVSEEVTELVLAEHLREHGGAVEHGHRLTGLVQSPEGVVATVEHDGESREVSAEWIVGCGGLRSPVRELNGIEFEGHAISQPWAVFDVTLTGWPHRYEANFAFLDEDPVIITALPGKRWRAYVRPASAESDLVADAARVIARYAPGVRLDDVENPVRFHCHTKVASRYRAGRALLAGDAAHVCSPSQGHGMNTGIQDAFNLAWKLALVCQGEADQRLLDSYEAERRPVAELVTGSGDDFETMQGLAGEDERRERDQAIRETFADPDRSHGEVLAETELNFSYAGSPVVGGESKGPGAGDRLPAEPVLMGKDGSTLHDVVAGGEGHHVLVIGRDPGEVDRAIARFAEQSIGLARTTARATGLTIGDSPGGQLSAESAERLGIDEMAWLVVRPDLYIGYRLDGDDPEGLDEYFRMVRDGGSKPGAGEAN